MQKVRAEQERTRNYRARRPPRRQAFVQLATPDLPTVNPGDDPARAIGTSDLPYRMEVSWDQTYNDVYLVDLKTGKPQKVLEHWGSAATHAVAGREVRPLLRRDERSLVHVPHRRRRAREPDREAPGAVPAGEQHARPARARTAAGGWTANDQSLLLYDEFDVWEVKPDGTGRADDHRTARGASSTRRSATARSIPKSASIPTNKPLLLAATNDARARPGSIAWRSPARPRPRRS